MIGYGADAPRDRALQPRAVLNAEKLMRLGWKPKYDLAAGLAHTIEICK